METIKHIRYVGTIEAVCRELRQLAWYYGKNAKLSDVIKKESKIKYVKM